MLDRMNHIDIQNLETINKNKKVEFAVGAIDLIDISAIFALFLKDVLHQLLEHSLKYIMFPLSAAATLIRAGLAWRQAILEKDTGLFVKAAVESLAAIAITTAVIGTLVFTPVFATISPIIFTVTLAAKALFHAGAAIFYLAKSMIHPEEKAKYKQLALGNAIAATTNALVATAVASVMLAGKTAVAVLGVASGIFGAAYALFKSYTIPTSFKKEAQPVSPVILEDEEDDNDYDQDKAPEHQLSQNAEIIKKLSAPPPSPVVKETKTESKNLDPEVNEANTPKQEAPVSLSSKTSPTLFVLPSESVNPPAKNADEFTLRKTS